MFAFKIEKSDMHRIIFKAAKIDAKTINKVKHEIEVEEEKAA